MDQSSHLSLLQSRHNAHLMSIVQETLSNEKARQKKIGKASSASAREKLSNQFAKERKREKERISRLQSEHQAIYEHQKQQSLNTQHYDVSTASNNNSSIAFGSGTSRSSQVVFEQPKKKNSTSSRLKADTVQNTEFYRKMYAKSEYGGSTSSSSRPSFLTESNLSSNDSLFKERQRLLSRLESVNKAIVHEEFNDTASTVRSSVSSFGSARSYASSSSSNNSKYKYIPFKR